MFNIKKLQCKICLMIIIVVMIGTLMTPNIFAKDKDSLITVYPSVETSPSRHPGDTADDTCVWIHPENKKLSLIIGDDKKGGLYAWNLDGTENQYLDEDSDLNNLDIRYNFKLGNQIIALIGVVNESDQCLSFYTVNPVTRLVEPLGSIPLDFKKPYGGCMYQSPKSGKFYFFVNWKDGTVQQWELNGDSGSIKGNMVRTFNVGSQVEGCVADDQLAKFYIGEENAGLWNYGAEPNDGSSRTMVDSVDASSGGRLTADVEGVTLYYGKNKDNGYLICSSQGNNTFQVYKRKNNEYIRSFTIGATDTIDETTETDGCDVSNVDLGGLFTKGVFIAHDHSNDNTDYSNHKLVSWKEIADKLDLDTDTQYNPTKGSNKGPKLKDMENLTVKANTSLSLTVQASDKEKNQIDYYALNLPEGAAFDSVTHQFRWTPNTNQTGTYEVEFIVTDGYQLDKGKVKIKVEK